MARPIPPRVIAIAQQLLTQNPGLTTGTDDQSRLFVKLVAEQAAFELGPAYGLKSAGSGRPQGPSQIAYNADTVFGGWRIVDADGSASGTKGGIVPNPPWQDFPNQLFLAVDPIDHLHVTDTRPPATSSSPLPPAVDLTPLFDRITALEAHLDALVVELSRMTDHVVWLDKRRYVAKVWGFTIVSSPETTTP